MAMPAEICEPGRAGARADSRARRRVPGLRADALDDLPAAPARTADGVAIAVLLNIADAGRASGVDPAICDGIGLVRTELLFHGPGGLPDEDPQYEAYRAHPRLGRRPARSRSARSMPAATSRSRATRGTANRTRSSASAASACRSRGPSVLAVQFRALARAAIHGTAEGHAADGDGARRTGAAGAILDDALATLEAEGIACRRPQLGMMVEVPAAALSIAAFDAALLLDRQQRPDAIRHRQRARHRGGRRP